MIEGPDKSHRFIIDPLDGTTNFLHGIPQFAISIALERETHIVSAVVYNPVADEMFTAEKSHGAYLNDKRLRVAARKSLSESLIATGIPFRGRGGHERFLEELPPIMASTSGVRRFGSAALDLAWVAAGRFDAFWERGLAPWQCEPKRQKHQQAPQHGAERIGPARAVHPESHAAPDRP